MAFEHTIEITKNTSGSGYQYRCATADQILVGDQVIFSNLDDAPHWPGLVDPTGKAKSPTTYFMPNQIAPFPGTSSPWQTGVVGTVTYADSLDTNPDKPTGTIVVGPAPSAPVIA